MLGTNTTDCVYETELPASNIRCKSEVTHIGLVNDALPSASSNYQYTFAEWHFQIQVSLYRPGQHAPLLALLYK